MPEKSQSTTEMQSESKTIYIGFTDLNHDADQVRKLIQDPNVKGILFSTLNYEGNNHSIYRPYTPNQTEKDIIKTIRRFLSITAAFGGKAALTIVKDEKDIPDRMTDFNGFYKALAQKSWIFDRE